MADPIAADPLFQAMHRNGLTRRDVAGLQGWVLEGWSGDPGTPLKLYLNLDETDYLEVPGEAVLAAERLPAGGGTIVWVNRALPVPIKGTREIANLFDDPGIEEMRFADIAAQLDWIPAIGPTRPPTPRHIPKFVEPGYPAPG